ncbi:single-stranded DNA-binding protein [Kocuria massiliensis]|uniref:single-stranded DNA-binding protein n=1 Tax=Kocuria massiliensis TaxID=1926282 RepID=UPI0022B9719E|nr:single-stranded DNA-binding protein [Kocuria massiliensis]
MANEPVINVYGNLVADPELRFTPSGVAVTNFTIMTPSRRKNGDAWEDGQGVAVKVSVWNKQAEHVAESLRKGQRIIVQGRMVGDKWQDKQTGDNRYGWHIDADEVSVSLMFGTAQFAKAPTNGGQGGQYPPNGGQFQQPGGYAQQGGQYTPQGGQSRFQGNPQGGQQADPWGQQGGGNYSWGNEPQSEEPPF